MRGGRQTFDTILLQRVYIWAKFHLYPLQYSSKFKEQLCVKACCVPFTVALKRTRAHKGIIQTVILLNHNNIQNTTSNNTGGGSSLPLNREIILLV